nr:reverse transcriptase domain-containing protein [Tanacetum cinerariifolium]
TYKTKNSQFSPFKTLSDPIQEGQLHKSLGERPVEPELRTIAEIIPMADRTMKELLQAPTEAYGEAIVILEILAENFEIKMNLLQDVVSKTDDRIDKLADQISNLVEIVNKQVIAPAKSVEKNCVTCGGAHAYYECIATDSNPSSVCAETGSYNQEKNLRRNLNDDTRNILSSFFQNQLSTSGTLPSNTIPNPKGEMKTVTNSSGLAYKGPSIPTESPLEKVDEKNTKEILYKEHSNSSKSTAQVQPPVVPISISEPDVLRTQSKPTIPYPSRLNDQKLRLKPTNQMEKFFQIFHDLHSDISFADALLLMPKFSSTIKRVAEVVFVKVGKFHFLIDFIVVDFEANPRVSLILGRSFLRTGRALIDVYGEKITLKTIFSLPLMDLKVAEESKEKYSIEEPPELELKDLPSHLEYAFLEDSNKLPVIIAKNLKVDEREALINVLNLWVSPIHCVPKKGGMTVVANENNEWIPTRLVTGWRVCIDYRKLNDATRKDHFPLPFMDQMLERPRKTTFTCPYGTFAYRRMPFGLCNAPSTFQRCMMSIFHDMIEEMMEVFMDDFSEAFEILKACHEGPSGGHHGANLTAKKGIDFMGPFPSSKGNKYIVEAVDYLSKWVEAKALPTKDARFVVKFLKSHFSQFGTPRAIISDRGTHFCNDQFTRVMIKYEVTHRLATAYHPQTSGQVEVNGHRVKHYFDGDGPSNVSPNLHKLPMDN